MLNADGNPHTGYILQNKEGVRCLIECGKVRWMTSEDFYKLMTPEN